MQPSSLIFLVIVAIWVAYLVQHWVRRREHLATARSVDRFSEAMRLLERRSPVPSTIPAKAGSALRGTSIFAATASDGAASGVDTAGPAPSPLRARSRTDGPLPPAHEIPLIELVPHRTPTQILLRRVRGILFLSSLVAVPVCLVMSAAHILKWLSVGIALGALVAVTVWLRVEAIREQRARRARRSAHRQLAESQPRVGQTSLRSRRTLTGPAAVAPRAAERAARQEQSRTPDLAAEPEAESEAAPGAWKPVPVPPPTYTLKEPAHFREPRPESNRPVPIEVEDEIESVPTGRQRRVVGR